MLIKAGEEGAEAQLLAGGMAEVGEVAPDPPGFMWVSEVVKLWFAWDILGTAELRGDALQHKRSNLSVGSSRVPTSSGKQEAKQLQARVIFRLQHQQILLLFWE